MTDSRAETAGGQRRVVLVTGLAGAGRSTALSLLEDLGYDAIDNLPLALVDATLAETAPRPLALGLDSRRRSFAPEPVLALAQRLRAAADLEPLLLFLDCDDETLLRRYSETRRPHPLAEDKSPADGIGAERRLLAPIQAAADLVLDTAGSSIWDLRRRLRGELGDPKNGVAKAPLRLFITSFSYRQGLPRSADLVFDVRFLDNPHYVDALRPMTGLDEAVAAFVAKDPDYADFMARLEALLRPLLPRYEAEGKSYLTIAIGCTGGRHRSVAVSIALADWLRKQERDVGVSHRDVEKSS